MPRASAPSAQPAAPAPAAIAAMPAGMPPTPTVNVASGLPPGVPPPRMGNALDPHVATGLANNFNGRVAAVWYLPRLYPLGDRKRAGAQGNREAYSLTRMIEIQADDHSLGDGGIVREFLRVDDLSQWVPSRTTPTWNGTDYIYTPAGSVSGRAATTDDYMALHNGAGFPVFNADGTPKHKKTKEGQPVYDSNGQPVPELALLAPEDWWGWHIVPGRENNRDALKKGTKDEQFLEELNRLGYPKRVAPHVNGYDMRSFLVGVYGKWVRLPFTFTGGAAPAGSDKIDTLCLAEILDLGPISGSQGASMVAVPGAVPAVPVPVAAPVMPSAPAAQMAVPVQQVALPVQAAPVAQAAAQPPNPARNDPAAVSAAANEIITQLVSQRKQLTKTDAGVPVMEGVNSRGLDGAMALRFLNDPAWMVDDERTFGYVPEQALIVPLPG